MAGRPIYSPVPIVLHAKFGQLTRNPRDVVLTRPSHPHPIVADRQTVAFQEERPAFG